MLKDLIQQDFKEAFRNQEKVRLSVLRMLRAELVKKQQDKRFQLKKDHPELEGEELDSKSALVEDEILGIIISRVKKSRESVASFEKGGRNDLIEREKEEIKILEKYLPEQLSEDDVREVVKGVVAKVGAESMKDIGRVMSELMPKVKGKTDGDLVLKIVRDILS